MPLTVRPITPEELPAWFEAFGTALYIWPNDPHAMAAHRRDSMELDRALGAFEDGQMVGTYRSFASRLTVPGGERIPVGAVSAVGVRPTHRRRGTLRRMITEDLTQSAARGEVASILIAAEWPIYGRFGYGPATWQARWTLHTRASTFRVPTTGSVEVVSPLVARQLLPAIYDAYAAAQPGAIDRIDQRWDVDLGLVEAPGRPKWKGQVAIHRNDAGEPDGYARFHGEENWVDMRPEHRILLDELHAATTESEVDLWRHLAQMDLTATIQGEVRREHEPVQWFLADPRAVQVTGRADFLWLRLLDIERGLGARRYERDGTLVLEIVDDLGGTPGPAGGRYLLEVRDGSASCARTEASPDLMLDVRAVSAAYLGGTRLVDATRAGDATEHRPGALREADALFHTADEPWCSTWF
ncbi:MAG TPA: GNAT family N-acetyltransferase [Candidatus Limnocylindria bacterium]|nr:GNAT family N-acetyltransferase [Candidatus Limnocylindria bacterium]